ncbi:MAG TPA: hypothetical protein VII94_03545 [Candidatus Saccharimonadales bacterium]
MNISERMINIVRLDGNKGSRMKAKTAKQVLQAMLWMYENTLGWTQGFSLTDKNNRPISIHDPGKLVANACLSGALQLVECDCCTHMSARQAIFIEIMEFIPTWNDYPGRKKSEVTKLLKKVISKL